MGKVKAVGASFLLLFVIVTVYTFYLATQGVSVENLQPYITADIILLIIGGLLYYSKRKS